MVKTMKGIDVSSHEGVINWDIAKDSIDFAIIRAGWGKNNIDETAKKNVEECEKNNIPFGLYWFSYAYTVEMARNEAKYLLQFVDGHIPLFPLYFDFEYDSVNWAKKKGVIITKQLLNDMASAFCDELENAGYYAGIYANDDYIRNMYGENIFKRYDLWYARWNISEPDRLTNLWQNSSDGKISGIDSYVDTDICYFDYPTLIKEKGFNKYKEETNFICPNNCPYCPHSKKVGA